MNQGEAVIRVELDAYKQEVALLEVKAGQLAITDDVSEEAALLFISECKRAHARLETERDQLVRPLNEEVKAINDGFRPYTTILDRLWRATDQARSLYVRKKQLAIEEANRKAIADAEQKRREEEAKAEAARLESERLRKEAERVEAEQLEQAYQAEMAKHAAEKTIRDEEQAVLDAKRRGDEAAAREQQARVDQAKRDEEARARKVEEDRLAALEEQHRLEKAAIKQDAKADIAESKATMVAPVIQVNDSVVSRTLLDGASVGTRKTKRWVFNNGLPATSTPCRDDPRFKDIGDEFFEFNPTIMNKMVKAGVRPKGVAIIEENATTLRK